MHILLTNDDGIEAAGIAALEAATRGIATRISVVAPAVEQSQCGHRVTTHEALRVEERGVNRWAVHGTPADCVRIALFGLELKPDLVLSGINHGGNMGQDLVISGTVAAVREAAYHGVPGVAFSHYIISGLAFDWERTARWTAALLQRLLVEPAEGDGFWNVNFPHLPPGPAPLVDVVRTKPARSPLKVAFRREGELHHYTARYAERPQDEGSDVQACFGGKISLSRIGL